uniref:Uncharacterized protein n=1 Tax=Vitis vinifera TaxID=29760 RepID=A5AV24_VITVI|nr:hypothetical protein VITISV_042931 [Vitis vinifera]
MLSMPFDPYIISSEPPRGFIVPKFTLYDGTSDPFDHIIYHRQLMTLDIGNDALIQFRSLESFPRIGELTYSYFSNRRTSILCMKMISELLLNKSWSPIIQPRVIRRGVLSPRTNQGKETGGKTIDSNSKIGGAPATKIMTTPLNNARVCITWWKNLSSEKKEVPPEPVVQAPVSLIALKVVINYIHRGPIDDKHNSRRQMRRLIHATSIRKWISSIQGTFVEGNVHPIVDIITFHPINNLGCLPFRFNEATTTSLSDIVLPVQADPITLSVWFSMIDDLSPYNAIMGHA